MSQLKSDYPHTDVVISDEDLKSLALANLQKSSAAPSFDFPTETISLPSRGILYPEGSALSSGTVEMKYMTAKEEDILTSQNLIQNGTVFDKLFQSLIVSPIKYNDLVVGDKNAIMVAARILGYGKDYGLSVKCPKCGEESEINIDLTALPEYSTPDDSGMVAPNLFEITLPASKAVILFSVLTHGMDKKIQYELDALKKRQKKDEGTSLLTTRLKHMIKSVNGNPDPEFIAAFVPNMLAIDSKALRARIDHVTPDIDFDVYFKCDHCGHEEEALPFEPDTNFFWPTT